MKKKVIRVCIMLMAFAMLPLMAEAKKIQMGQFVSYDGKLDEEGIPEGKGTLLTNYGSFDFLKGVFSKGMVTEAELLFGSTDKKNFLAKFEGTLDWSVAPDGSSVKYILKDGFFTGGNMRFYIKDQPFIIVRIPSDNECKFQYNGYLMRYEAVTEEKGNDAYQKFTEKITKPVNVISFNPIHYKRKEGYYEYWDLKYYNTTAYGLDVNFTPQMKENYLLLKCEDGLNVTRQQNVVSIMYPNGDYTCYEYGSGAVIGFRKRTNEGTVTYKGNPVMDFISSNNQKGIASFEIYPDMSYERFGFPLNSAKTLADLNIKTIVGKEADAAKIRLQAEGLEKQILATIDDHEAPFAKEEAYTNNLLALGKSDERTVALLNVYNHLLEMANKADTGTGINITLYGKPGHKGSVRGKQEIALAERIKKQMNDEGNNTFGFLPGQREDDVIVRTGGFISAGTKIRRKNGVLVFDDTGRTFTMNDGTMFKGLFKEELDLYGEAGESYEVKGNEEKLLLADELTPWHGPITYADGTTDALKAGKSVNAAVKAANAQIEAELKSVKADLTRLSQKYGAAINSLKSTGNIKVGYSVAMIDEYLKVYNKYKEASVKKENGRHNPLALHYYEPSVRDIMQYGKTAKRVKVFGTWFANEIVVGNFMMANGKVTAIYQQTSIPIK